MIKQLRLLIGEMLLELAFNVFPKSKEKEQLAKLMLEYFRRF